MRSRDFGSASQATNGNPLALTTLRFALLELSSCSSGFGSCGLVVNREDLIDMEHRKDEKNAPWMSVPQFGDWDQKGPLPDYSLDFSKIREKRKQNKRDISRASIGNDEELISSYTSSNTSKLNTTNNSAPPHHSYDDDHHSPTGRRSILSYFNCCVRADV
ncbi:hypothetical protein SSX86_011329 [Deinandra increscens subsp. villosa]|uniref:RIN4 pathogenic type III effector avirulence factor Avr cleavage site domain-containing protein n=1 Tax=Deinandra increscens subsp. villosa TaxID=3103831 RepID=A0AAP0D7V0_9ASTR